MSLRFRRDGEDVVVGLAADEVRALGELADQLQALLGDPDPDDPAIERLFPAAYSDPTEDRAEREWQALAGPDLLRTRLDALGALSRSIGASPIVLGPDDQQRWLTVLNDLRLVLGARLGLRDDAEPEATAAGSAAAPLVPVYRWLTMLQGDLVEVLLEREGG